MLMLMLMLLLLLLLLLLLSMTCGMVNFVNVVKLRCSWMWVR